MLIMKMTYFLVIIGYDLRDPITSLVTYADIFINYFDKLDPDKLRTIL